MTVRALLSLALVLAAYPVAARDIFVSLTGNDLNPGSVNEPLRTVRVAVAQAQTGDRILIEEGTYREAGIYLDATGTANAPIIIQAQPGHEVWIKGSAEVTGWEPLGDDLWVKRGWNVNSQQVFVNGEILQQIGGVSALHGIVNVGRPIINRRGTGVSDMFPGSFYADPNGDLYCMLPDRGNPNDFLMEASVCETDLFRTNLETSYLRLIDLNFAHNNETAHQVLSYLVHMSGSHWIIDGCSFSFSDGVNLIVTGDNHIIRNSTFSSGGISNIFVHGGTEEDFVDGAPIHRNLLIDSCVVEGANYRLTDHGWGAGGIKAIPNVRGLIVQNSTFRHNFSTSLWWDESFGSNYSLRNDFIDNHYTGLYIEVTEASSKDTYSVLVEDNLFVNSPNYAGCFISQSQDVVARYNTFVGLKYAFYLGEQGRGGDAYYFLRNNHMSKNLIALESDKSTAFKYDKRFTTTTNNVLTDNYWALETDGVRTYGHFSIIIPGGFEYYWKPVDFETKSPLSGDMQWGDLFFTDPGVNDYRVVGPSLAQSYGRRW